MVNNLKNTKLWLDDLRPAPPGYDWVKTYDEFVEYIEKYGVPDLIDLDHDLSFAHYPFNEDNPHPTIIPYDSYKEKTGFHAAKYIVENRLPLKQWRCHSQNTVGKSNIEGLLRQYERILRNEDPRFK